MQHHEESPFHAVGFALMAYVEAMLGFETDKIQTALERIAAAEILARQFIKKAKRKSWHSGSNNKKSTTLEDDVVVNSISFNQNDNNQYQQQQQQQKKIKSPEIQYELLATNCMLMSSTIQFLRNSWLEYMKAAYKLRKAYKLYEQMFESLTGQKASEYASILRSTSIYNNNSSSAAAAATRRSTSITTTTTTPFEQPHRHNNNNNNLSLSSIISNTNHVKSTWNEKRMSLFHIPSTQHTNTNDNTFKKRPMSTLDLSLENLSATCDNSIQIIDNAIESGIFFGIGLFSLVFSLLPPRGA